MGKNTIKHNDNTFPLVSIGLPVVKKEFLEQAIICCLHQTYSNLEIIILNNAPTKTLGDDIENIVFSFANDKIKYFRNETQIPIIENWNKVLSLSTGYYFSILCDDDRWDEKFIENMVDLAAKYPQNTVFHSRVMIINESDEIIRIGPNLPECEDIFDFIYNRLTGRREQYLSDFFVKTDSLKQTGGFVNMPSAWGSDDLTWFYLAKDAGIIASSEPLYFYRESGLSVTNKMALKNKVKVIDIYLEEIKKILKDIPPKKDSFLALKKKMVLNYFKIYKKETLNCYYYDYLLKMNLPNILFYFFYFICKVKVYFIVK